jgi:type IV pilus assembly protein PilQ
MVFPSSRWAEGGSAPVQGAAVETPALAPEPSAHPEPVPVAHGRPIDLDVHDADIREVCRLLADVGKVNVVVADGVAGTVTVRLRRVPWDEALDAILAAKGLVAHRQGSVVIVSAQ